MSRFYDVTSVPMAGRCGRLRALAKWRRCSLWLSLRPTRKRRDLPLPQFYGGYSLKAQPGQFASSAIVLPVWELLAKYMSFVESKGVGQPYTGTCATMKED